jgi:hypothetical protein
MSDEDPARSVSKTGAGNSRNSSVPLGAPCVEELPCAPRAEPKPDSVAPWVPESTFAPAANETISFVRNILLTNPLFPRFYADVVLSSAPNSKEAKILRPRYQKILKQLNQKANSMTHTKTCTHIKVTGVRCGSPALYGEQFCYFHQHAHRGVRKPAQSRLHPIAILEDEESIQSALMEVINALMRNTIDLKRATLILRALHIAVKNAHRVKFAVHGRESVREVPEYAEPAPAEPARSTYRSAEEERADKNQLLAQYFGVPAEVIAAATAASAQHKAAAVDVSTPAHPPALDVPVPSAAAQPKPTQSVPAHNFEKKTEPQSVPDESPNMPHRPSAGRPAAVNTPAASLPVSEAQGTAERNPQTQPQRRSQNPPSPPRKPAATAPAPKERKSAAQRASAG